MKKYNFKEWFVAAGIRAVKTFAQTTVSLITVGQAFIEVNWLYVFSVGVTAAIVSFLTSLGGLPELNHTDQ